MSSMYCIFVLLTIFVGSSWQVKILPKEVTFTAGVVDVVKHIYLDHFNFEDEETFKSTFYTLIQAAKQKNLDMLIFPSSLHVAHKLLRSFIPEPNKEVSLCNDTSGYLSQVLRNISCEAKNAEVYVLFDYSEVEGPPTDCRFFCTGRRYYQTYMVFDRKGALVLKYRRRLLVPNIREQVSNPGSSEFEPDFNIDFGKFLCLSAAREDTDRWGTKKVVVNVQQQWYSELVSAEEWCKNTSLWTRDSHSEFFQNGFQPRNRCGRLWDRSGPNFMPTRSKTNPKMLTLIDPVMEGPCYSQSSVVLLYSYTENFVISQALWSRLYSKDFSVYESELIPEQTNMLYRTFICQYTTCCFISAKVVFDVKLAADSNTSYYRYRVGLYNGTRIVSVPRRKQVPICVVIPCLDASEESCGKIFEDKQSIKPVMRFEYLHIAIRDMDHLITDSNTGLYNYEPHYPYTTQNHTDVVRFKNYEFP